MKAVVKKKKPLLLQKHKKERIDFVIRHKDWTLEDWKRVVWLDEIKINYLGSNGRNELGKGQESVMICIFLHSLFYPLSYFLSGQPSSAVEVAQSHRLIEGKTRV